MQLHTYHLAPLADALYDQLESDDLRHRGWRFALYRALRSSVKADDKPIYWKTEYHQWSVDHHYRGSKHRASLCIEDCRIDSIQRTSANGYHLRVVFTDMDGHRESADCELNRSQFPGSLWRAKNADGDTLLEGSFERDRIFDGLCGRATISGEAEGSAPLQDPTDRHPKLTALHAMVEALRPWYEQASPAEQSYIETVVGAAVFYLPQTIAHFSGYISMDALRGSLEEERRVKDHIYPRKRAGRHLLSTPCSATMLHDLYHGEMARFMYLTPAENARMINYYEVYKDHDTALEALGILKFPFPGQDPFRGNSEIKAFLQYVVRERVPLDDSEAMRGALEALRAKQNS